MQHKTAANFSKIAGCLEAKTALKEVIDYFKNPEKYTSFGARLPRGILIYGPPGTGKTMLARATAGEAGVNFIQASGSEFIEVYIGIGPRRVREIFAQARENSPCILFIDEIESLATSRSLLENATNFESQATINQLLTEMDGFTASENVVVIGATNR
jgi:ATP-dependent Zn protease